MASTHALCWRGSPGLTPPRWNQERDRRAVRQCQWVSREVVGRGRHVSWGNLEVDGAVLWPHHVPGEWKVPAAQMGSDLAEVTKRRHVQDWHMSWRSDLGCQLHRRMDRHAATRRRRALAEPANVTTARMLRHTFVTTMLDAGVNLVASRSLRDMPIRGRPSSQQPRPPPPNHISAASSPQRPDDRTCRDARDEQNVTSEVGACPVLSR